ncbi:VMO1 protein, partial [Aramus guarauna]|nr:VMO1 protein [Aramus guarauna]
PLVLLVVLLVVPGWGHFGDNPSEVIAVDNGGPWGEWGEPEFCPGGTHTTGFQLKVGPRGHGGDTG